MTHIRRLCHAVLTGLVLTLPLAATAETVQFATSGPWSLFRSTEGGRVVSCQAEMIAGSERVLIFRHDAAETAFGFMGQGSMVPTPDTGVEVWFDTDRAGGGVIDMPPADDLWRLYRTSNDEPDGLLDSFANAGSINFSYFVPNPQDRSLEGYVTETFSLRGSSAMTQAIYACVQQAAATTPAPARLDWVPFRPGLLGPGLVVAATLGDGAQVFVCAVQHAGGFHPGMTGRWSDGCSIGYGGREVVATGHYLLSGAGNWRPFDGGPIPADAVEGGSEADGRTLYICRSARDGVAGKYRPGFRGCNIGDGGSEVAVTPFDILTF